MLLSEAVNRAIRADASMAATIPESRQVVAFRNILAHGYDGVSDALVWSIATESFPAVAERARALLAG